MVIKLVKKVGPIFILFLFTILLAYLMKTHNIRVPISSEILTKPLWKLKISSHWVPIFLVYFASQKRAKIKKIQFADTTHAIINCVFKMISTLDSLLFN